jgi:hypothetical protein
MRIFKESDASGLKMALQFGADGLIESRQHLYDETISA